jgi:hypothetical protein
VPKDTNLIPDYNTLIDLQMQLKREQQRIEERIKSELLKADAANNNHNASTGSIPN